MSSRSRQWRFRLHHIIEALEKIHNYVDGMSMEGFLADSRTSDAILRNLEIIGEAARLVPTTSPYDSIRSLGTTCALCATS